jgi:cyclopropane fatty-acyl-phospholipid synthase-like methyltransferase
MSIYDDEFYQSQSDSSYVSALSVVPKIIEIFQVNSVVDVGCGVGTWLRAFNENGVSDVFGIDGDYVNTSQLLVSEDKFHAHDLSKPLHMNRKFDCCISLEVAEHLPPSSSEDFVASLTRLSDVVLFSAAIPNQGGVMHINERWQSYWVQLFLDHGYVPHCDIRKYFWNDVNVSDWYRQNLLVFVNEKNIEPLSSVPIVDIVHPETFTRVLRQTTDGIPTVPSAFKILCIAFCRSLSHRFGPRKY